jgi:hypothetical protein
VYRSPQGETMTVDFFIQLITLIVVLSIAIPFILPFNPYKSGIKEGITVTALVLWEFRILLIFLSFLTALFGAL